MKMFTNIILSHIDLSNALLIRLTIHVTALLFILQILQLSINQHKITLTVCYVVYYLTTVFFAAFFSKKKLFPVTRYPRVIRHRSLLHSPKNVNHVNSHMSNFHPILKCHRLAKSINSFCCLINLLKNNKILAVFLYHAL